MSSLAKLPNDHRLVVRPNSGLGILYRMLKSGSTVTRKEFNREVKKVGGREVTNFQRRITVMARDLEKFGLYAETVDDGDGDIASVTLKKSDEVAKRAKEKKSSSKPKSSKKAKPSKSKTKSKSKSSGKSSSKKKSKTSKSKKASESESESKESESESSESASESGEV